MAQRTPDEVDALMARLPPTHRRLCVAGGAPCGCCGCIAVPALYGPGVRPVSPAEFAAWTARRGDLVRRLQVLTPDVAAADVAGDLVLVGFAEGDDDQAFVLRRLTSTDDKIPAQAADGSWAAVAKTGKKAWLSSDTRINLSRGTSAPGEPAVLGEKILAMLSTVLGELASHQHTYMDSDTQAGPPSSKTTSAPTNASAFTAAKESPVDDRLMLSDFVFLEK